MRQSNADLRVGSSFEHRERLRQTAYFDAEFPGKAGYGGMPFRLRPPERALNLAPAVRDMAFRYFRDRGISWHTHSNHALSSQVCCSCSHRVMRRWGAVVH
jgi:hypothetical protein